MSVEFFIQIVLKGLFLSFLEAVGYYLDIKSPFVTLLTKLSILFFLYKYKEQYQILRSQYSHTTKDLWFITSAAKKLEKNKALKFLTKYTNSKDIYYDFVCLVFAFCIRFVIDILRYVLSSSDQKENWASDKAHVSDVALSLWYVIQIGILFFFIYHLNVKALLVQNSKKSLENPLSVSNILNHYLYNEALLLLAGFLGMFLMIYTIMVYFEQVQEVPVLKFFKALRNSSHLILDTIVRLWCVYYVNLLYYLNVSEQISEIVVLFMYITYKGLRSIFNPLQEDSKKVTKKVDQFYKVMTNIGIYFFGLALEIQMLYLDFELNLDIRLLFLAVVTQCIVYFCIQQFKKRNNAPAIIRT